MATKAKRKLKEITFEHDGAHVALTAKAQGGPANGKDYSLVLKSARPKEVVEKIQAIQVTMELPDFLEKFFYVWGEDAKALAFLMGYQEPADTQAMENQEAQDDFNKWAERRFESFEIMKSLKDSKTLELDVVKLSDNEYLNLLKDQLDIEKAMGKISTSDGGSTVEVENNKAVEPSGSKVTKSKGKSKMDEVVELQKANEAMKAELEKAQLALQALQEKEKEAITKAKSDKVTALVKNEKAVAALLKGALALDSSEDFDAFVCALEAINADIAAKDELINKAAMFSEQGVDTTEASAGKESAVAKIVKANLAKK